MSKCKAPEIPRNEAYARGIRYRAQGSRQEKFFFVTLRPKPYALRHSHTSQ